MLKSDDRAIETTGNNFERRIIFISIQPELKFECLNFAGKQSKRNAGKQSKNARKRLNVENTIKCKF